MAEGYEWIFDFPTVIDSTKTWDKVAISNDYITPKFPNLKKLGELYDTKVLRITESGELYIWGCNRWASYASAYSSWIRQNMERC